MIHWRDNDPVLLALALDLLAIPAASAPVERVIVW